MYGASAAITSRSSGDSSSTSEISRATARGVALAGARDQLGDRRRRRCRPPSLSSLSCRDAHDQGVALAAAAAQRGRADAAAAALELEREVQHDAGAGHADRVAERDRAAVDVDLVLVDAELAGGRDADRGERLVELDEVEVGGGDALLLAGLGGRVGGLQLQRRVGAGDHAVRADLGEPARGRAPRPWPCSSRRRRTAPSEICEAEPAVMVPSLLNAGRSLASDSAVVSPRTPSSWRDHDRVALALRDLDRHDLVVEDAVLPGRGGALVRAGGELVLLLAGELVARRRCSCSVRPPIACVGELVVERVVGHRVDQRACRRT